MPMMMITAMMREKIDMVCGRRGVKHKIFEMRRE